MPSDDEITVKGWDDLERASVVSARSASIATGCGRGIRRSRLMNAGRSLVPETRIGNESETGFAIAHPSVWRTLRGTLRSGERRTRTGIAPTARSHMPYVPGSSSSLSTARRVTAPTFTPITTITASRSTCAGFARCTTRPSGRSD
jgi:hypothetical protein